MKKILTLIACMLTIFVASAKDNSPEVSEVSAVGEGIGNGGRPMIAVTLSAKKADKITQADFEKAAVRCVLFRGWVDAQSMDGLDTSTRHGAICNNPDVEVQHADYFNDFFSSGEAANYVTVIPDTKRVLKKGKVVEVTETVTVDQRALRKKMERDNIIKKLRRDF